MFVPEKFHPIIPTFDHFCGGARYQETWDEKKCHLKATKEDPFAGKRINIFSVFRQTGLGASFSNCRLSATKESAIMDLKA
jgi:hypothetical protein